MFVLKYPIAIRKNLVGAYEVIVPDLPECACTDRTIDAALLTVREKIDAFLEEQLKRGEAFPEPGTIVQCVIGNACPEAVAWSLVGIDPADIGQRVELKVSFANQVLWEVDRTAVREGRTRDGLIRRAVDEYVTFK